MNTWSVGGRQKESSGVTHPSDYFLDTVSFPNQNTKDNATTGHSLWATGPFFFSSRSFRKFHGPDDEPDICGSGGGAGGHFDGQIIVLCVSWYTSFKFSLRDLAIMMADRGITVTHTTILKL